MAARGDTLPPRRLVDGRRQAARHRPPAPPATSGRADSRPRTPAAGRRRGGPGLRCRPRRGGDSRRPAPPHLRRLSPDPLARSSRRAHAAHGRGPAHRRDRASVPGPRRYRGAAHRPCQAVAGGGTRAVRDATADGARAAPGVGARSRLPHLQRGVRRHRRRRLDAPRAVRGCAPPGPGGGEPAARRAGGPRPGGADGDSGLADPSAHRSPRRPDPPARPGPLALGPGPDPARPGGAGPVGGPRPVRAPPARAVRAPGRDRGLPRSRAAAAGHGLGPDRGALRCARADSALAGGGAQPCGRREPRVRAGGGAGARGAVGRGAGSPLLPPPPQRARRPARAAGTERGGASRVSPCRLAHAQRARANAAPPARRGRLTFAVRSQMGAKSPTEGPIC